MCSLSAYRPVCFRRAHAVSTRGVMRREGEIVGAWRQSPQNVLGRRGVLDWNCRGVGFWSGAVIQRVSGQIGKRCSVAILCRCRPPDRERTLRARCSAASGDGTRDGREHPQSCALCSHEMCKLTRAGSTGNRFQNSQRRRSPAASAQDSVQRRHAFLKLALIAVLLGKRQRSF